MLPAQPEACYRLLSGQVQPGCARGCGVRPGIPRNRQGSSKALHFKWQRCMILDPKTGCKTCTFCNGVCTSDGCLTDSDPALIEKFWSSSARAMSSRCTQLPRCRAAPLVTVNAHGHLFLSDTDCLTGGLCKKWLTFAAFILHGVVALMLRYGV